MNPLYQIKDTGNGNAELFFNGERKSTGTLGSITQMANDAVYGTSVGPAVISTQGVKKDILDPIKDSITSATQTSDGTKTDPQQTPVVPPTAEETLLRNELEKQKTDVQKRADADIASMNSILDPLKASLTAGKASQISNIQSQYSILRSQAEQANARRNTLQETIGVRFGGRFDPEHTADLVQDQVNQGISKIQELNQQEQEAISTISNAFDDKSYSLAVKEFDNLTAIRKERDDKLSEIEKAQVDGLQKIRDEQKLASVASIVGNLMKNGTTSVPDILATLNTAGTSVSAEDLKKVMDLIGSNPDIKAIGDLRSTAINNGAPPDVIDAISKSKTFGDAYKASGNFGKGGTGIIGEYNLAVAGGYKGTPDQYMTEDANRKRQIVNMNAGGLTTPENSTYLTITNKYQADPIVNAALKAGQINALANQIIADPNSTTNQLASLYIFVKNLDPDSAVREGELSLANQTQSYLQKFNNSLTRVAKGQVISPDAAKQLAQATKALVTTWEQTANTKTNLYQSQANNSSPNVGSAFQKYISDFKNSPTTTESLKQDEETAHTSLSTYVTNHPEQKSEIATRIASMEKSLGRKASSAEFLEAYPEYK